MTDERPDEEIEQDRAASGPIDLKEMRIEELLGELDLLEEQAAWAKQKAERSPSFATSVVRYASMRQELLREIHGLELEVADLREKEALDRQHETLTLDQVIQACQEDARETPTELLVYYVAEWGDRLGYRLDVDGDGRPHFLELQ